MLIRFDRFEEDKEVPARYLKEITDALRTDADADLDEQEVEVEDAKFDISDTPGVRPTALGVFPVRCLVETMCGEEDEPEQWYPADIVQVIPFQGKEKMPIDKLTPSDGSL